MKACLHPGPSLRTDESRSEVPAGNGRGGSAQAESRGELSGHQGREREEAEGLGVYPTAWVARTVPTPF